MPDMGSPLRDTASEEVLQELLQEEGQLQAPQLPMLGPRQLWQSEPAAAKEALPGPTQMWGLSAPEPTPASRQSGHQAGW